MLLIYLASACGPSAGSADGGASAVLDPGPVPHFSVRGRFSGPISLGLRIDESDSPLPPGVFRAGVLEAIAIWNATGLVRFEESIEGAPSDVLCAWRRGVHDACTSFGHDTSVAHAGPVASGTFVHFDLGREWSLDGEDGLPLTQVALHELGHVIGLDHSLDEAAVMHANYDARRITPALSDLAGLASLYGGLEDGPGDLHVLRAGESQERPLLRRIAPIDLTGVALWDVDGDGQDEVLVWRTDVAGHGRLMVYQFGPDLKLASTQGPMIDCVQPGARTILGTNLEGEGVLLSVLSEGHYSARRFQESAFPEPLPRGVPFSLREGFADEDGDGILDVLPDGWDEGKSPNSFSGDLDGDGVAEQISRR